MEKQAALAGVGLWVNRVGPGRWNSARVVDVYEYMRARGEAKATEVLGEVDDDDEQVSICWGCVPALFNDHEEETRRFADLLGVE